MWKIPLLVALGLRIAFIIVGNYIDIMAEQGTISVRYTDIDYHVFSDASAAVSQKYSPYERATYRYPPILAWLLIPNVSFASFGKILFSFADAALVYEIFLLLKSFYPESASTAAWLWVINPASINICTRGSADSITNFLVVTVVRRLALRSSDSTSTQQRSANEYQSKDFYHILFIGILYGLVVYLRIYPVIYMPVFVFYLVCSKSPNDTWNKSTIGYSSGNNIISGNDSNKGAVTRANVSANMHVSSMDTTTSSSTSTSHNTTGASGHTGRELNTSKKHRQGPSTGIGIKSHGTRFRNALLFSTAAISTVVGLGIVSYAAYGADYLENAVLYHTRREDHRHNFSPHFYWHYLQHASKPDSPTCSSSPSSFSTSPSAAAAAAAASSSTRMDNTCTPEPSSQSYQYEEYKDEETCINSGFPWKWCSNRCGVDASACWMNNWMNGWVDIIALALPKLVLFMPQCVLLVAITIKFAATNLPCCILLQTMTFVAYNQVITAQYFTWYLCLLPICLPCILQVPRDAVPTAAAAADAAVDDAVPHTATKRSLTVTSAAVRATNTGNATTRRLVVVLVCTFTIWCAVLSHWLYQAYRLEILGEPLFQEVWTASLLFHVASALVVGVFISITPVHYAAHRQPVTDIA